MEIVKTSPNYISRSNDASPKANNDYLINFKEASKIPEPPNSFSIFDHSKISPYNDSNPLLKEAIPGPSPIKAEFQKPQAYIEASKSTKVTLGTMEISTPDKDGINLFTFTSQAES